MTQRLMDRNPPVPFEESLHEGLDETPPRFEFPTPSAESTVTVEDRLAEAVAPLVTSASVGQLGAAITAEDPSLDTWTSLTGSDRSFRMSGSPNQPSGSDRNFCADG